MQKVCRRYAVQKPYSKCLFGTPATKPISNRQTLFYKVYQNPKYICCNIFLARYFWFDLLRLLVVCLFDN